MRENLIKAEPTPNPRVMKFSLGRKLTEEPYEVALEGPLPNSLEPLFGMGATTVFVGGDYLSVGITTAEEWEALAPRIISELGKIGEEDKSLWRTAAAETANDPVVTKITALLDSHIRPAVARDGGDVRFHSFDDKGVLRLEMVGACAGCPSSTATLKQGIRNMMRHFVPEVVDVEAASA